MKLGTNFFDSVRESLFEGSLLQSQVDNLNTIALAFVKHGDGDYRKLAYIFATALGEVGRRLDPVRETFAASDAEAIARLDAAFAAGKLKSVKTPYWRDGWFGRGYPQLTHESNYAVMQEKSGHHVHDNRDLMLRSDVAADVMVIGMMGGFWTSKKLSDYITAAKADYANARRIVNGTDRAKEFADYASKFETALQGADLSLPFEATKEKPMFNSAILSIVRHILTSVGGAATGGGIIAGDDLTTLAGAITTIIGFIAGILDKSKK